MTQACPDSAGDETVQLPVPYSSHNYKLRVSTIAGVTRAASACSSKFEIRGRDLPERATPSPTSSGGSEPRREIRAFRECS